MRKLLICILLIMQFEDSKPQAFSIDNSFNFGLTGDIISSVYGLYFDTDSKFMIYGDFSEFATFNAATRIFNDGSIDYSWHYYDNLVMYIKHVDNYYFTSTNMIPVRVDYYGNYMDTMWYHNLNEDNVCEPISIPYMFDDGSFFAGTQGVCNGMDSKSRWFKRFLPDGHMDTNFRHNANGSIFGIVPYSSNKLLLYGFSFNFPFTEYDSVPYFRLCRIDTVGNLDTSFKNIFTPTITEPRSIVPVYVQNDGKILISGFFFVNGINDTLNFARINCDGSLDTTFNNFNNIMRTNYGVWQVQCASPTLDGGYLYGGTFREYQGHAKNNIVKVDANGFIDTNYFHLGIDSSNNQTNTFTPYVSSIVRDSNDRYYIMGMFNLYEGHNVKPIFRIKGLSAGLNEEKEIKNEIQLYPNPAKDEVNLNFSKAIANGVVEIYDVSGVMVREISLKGRQSHYVLSTENLAAGFYIITVKNEKGVVGVTKMTKCN